VVPKPVESTAKLRSISASGAALSSIIAVRIGVTSGEAMCSITVLYAGAFATSPRARHARRSLCARRVDIVEYTLLTMPNTTSRNGRRGRPGPCGGCGIPSHSASSNRSACSFSSTWAAL